MKKSIETNKKEKQKERKQQNFKNINLSYNKYPITIL